MITIGVPPPALFFLSSPRNARGIASFLVMGAAHCECLWVRAALYEAYRCPTAAPTAANRGLPTARSYTRSSRSRPRQRACILQNRRAWKRRRLRLASGM